MLSTPPDVLQPSRYTPSLLAEPCFAEEVEELLVVFHHVESDGGTLESYRAQVYWACNTFCEVVEAVYKEVQVIIRDQEPLERKRKPPRIPDGFHDFLVIRNIIRLDTSPYMA